MGSIDGSCYEELLDANEKTRTCSTLIVCMQLLVFAFAHCHGRGQTVHRTSLVTYARIGGTRETAGNAWVFAFAAAAACRAYSRKPTHCTAPTRRARSAYCHRRRGAVASVRSPRHACVMHALHCLAGLSTDRYLPSPCICMHPNKAALHTTQRLASSPPAALYTSPCFDRPDDARKSQ